MNMKRKIMAIVMPANGSFHIYNRFELKWLKELINEKLPQVTGSSEDSELSGCYEEKAFD
jgi:hypothetical protein